MSHAGQVPRGPCSKPKPVFPAPTTFPHVLQPGACWLPVASTLFPTGAVSLTQKTLSVPSQNRRENDPRAPSLFTWELFLGQHLLPPISSTRPGLGCKPQEWTLAPTQRTGTWGLRTYSSWEPGSETQHSQTLPREPVRRQAPHCWLWGRIPATATSVTLALCSCPSKLKAGPVFPIGKCSVLLPPARDGGDGGRLGSSPSGDKGTSFPDASPDSSVQTPAPLDSLKSCRK